MSTESEEPRDSANLSADDIPAHQAGTASGPPAAFAELYRQENRKVYGFLVRRVNDPQQAEDMAQQTWLDFFAWWPTHPEISAPTAVLFTIARRRIFDYFRRQNRATPVEGSDLETLAAGLAQHVTDDCDIAVLRVDLQVALAALPARQRQVLELHYIDDLSAAACAKLIGTGVDNVKKILKRALRTLRGSPYLASYGVPATTSQEVRR
ncbi:RNA polymerase sigma factor [Streptomyces sp. NPDC086082]|uniref:RNA polymerase sigma factor n=1 Tax=Streptomyces sp. NPDC086082 TaxID=3365750 RepID=UPI0038207354